MISYKPTVFFPGGDSKHIFFFWPKDHNYMYIHVLLHSLDIYLKSEQDFYFQN